MIYAALLAGGVGNRIGADTPKQFVLLDGRPLLAHCIDKFIKVECLDEIIVSSPKEYIKQTNTLVEEYFPSVNNIIVIQGGETREGTIMNSISYIEDKSDFNDNPIVATHDAARIFVSPNQIRKSISYAKKYGASAPIIPSNDVMVKSLDGTNIHSMPDRNQLFHVQTPQTFHIHEYKRLYESLSEDEKKVVKEAVKVFYLHKKDIYLFKGENNNFKITTPFDLKIAESIIKS